MSDSTSVGLYERFRTYAMMAHPQIPAADNPNTGDAFDCLSMDIGGLESEVFIEAIERAMALVDINSVEDMEHIFDLAVLLNTELDGGASWPDYFDAWIAKEMAAVEQNTTSFLRKLMLFAVGLDSNAGLFGEILIEHGYTHQAMQYLYQEPLSRWVGCYSLAKVVNALAATGAEGEEQAVQFIKVAVLAAMHTKPEYDSSSQLAHDLAHGLKAVNRPTKIRLLVEMLYHPAPNGSNYQEDNPLPHCAEAYLVYQEPKLTQAVTVWMETHPLPQPSFSMVIHLNNDYAMHQDDKTCRFALLHAVWRNWAMSLAASHYLPDTTLGIQYLAHLSLIMLSGNVTEAIQVARAQLTELKNRVSPESKQIFKQLCAYIQSQQILTDLLPDFSQ